MTILNIPITVTRSILGKNHPTHLPFNDAEEAFFAGGEVEYTAEVTPIDTLADGQEVWFGLGYTQQGKTIHGDANIGGDGKPVNGWYLRLTNDILAAGDPVEMDWVGSPDIYGIAGDISMVTCEPDGGGNTLTFVVSLRYSLDTLSLRNPAKPFDRYRLTTQFDREALGAARFTPSVWDASGARHLLFEVWVDEQSADCEEVLTSQRATYALPVRGDVGTDGYTTYVVEATPSTGGDTVSSVPYAGSITIRDDGSTDFDIELTLTQVPTGTSLVTDLDGQFSVVFVEPKEESGKPWTVNSPSEAVYYGTGAEDAGRITGVSWNDLGLSTSGGFTDWTISVQFTLGNTGLVNGGTYHFILNAGLSDGVTGDVWLVNSQMISVNVEAYERHEDDVVVGLFETDGHALAVRGRILSNLLLNSTFTGGIPSPWPSTASIDQSCTNACAIDRYVFACQFEPDTWTSIKPTADYTDDEWRSMLKGMRASLAHNFYTANGLTLTKYEEWGVRFAWSEGGDYVTAFSIGEEDGVEVVLNGTDLWMNRIFEPLPAEKKGLPIPWSRGSMINGREVGKAEWDRTVAQEGAVYYPNDGTLIITSTEGRAWLDFEFMETTVGDPVCEVVFFKGDVAYITQDATTRSTLGYVTDTGTPTVYATDRQVDEARRINDDFSDFETSNETYPFTPSKTALIVVDDGLGGTVRNQHTTGLVDSKYYSSSYDYMNEDDTRVAVVGAAIRVNRDLIAFETEQDRFLHYLP